MKQFDAIIVGAGVAGCATALELRKFGCNVGLLGNLHCIRGVESLSPGAVRSLARLSGAVGRDVSEIVAWWGSEDTTTAMYSSARVAERSELANSLRTHAAECGVVVFESKPYLCIERSGGAWSVEFQTLG